MASDASPSQPPVPPSLATLIERSKTALQTGQELGSIGDELSRSSSNLSFDVQIIDARLRWLTNGVLEQLKVLYLVYLQFHYSANAKSHYYSWPLPLRRIWLSAKAQYWLTSSSGMQLEINVARTWIVSSTSLLFNTCHPNSISQQLTK
jgi:hypothetical protein